MSLYQDTKQEVSYAGTFVHWGVIFMLAVGILGFLGNVMGFYSYAFWAPKKEQVRYNVFKESQSYNDGMLRDLENLKMEYQQANPDQKLALRAIILHRFSVYDVNRLPMDLQSFYISVQGV